MASVTKEDIINALHRIPATEREIGWNSALIFILQSLVGEGEPPSPKKVDTSLVMGMKHYGFNSKLINSSMEAQIMGYVKGGQTLQAVKRLKEVAGLGLEDAKDVIDYAISRY
jgi:ribosomal protein L7/L12